MKLSIIIPFGLSKERNYIEERVRSKANEFRSDDKVEYIFVEGYSSLKHDLKNFIESKGHIYIKDESQIDFFSQGKCRNLGASFANAKVITFLDVDCYISSFSLEKILNLIDVKNISQNINEILVLPVIYLSKEGSEFIYKQDKKMWDDIIKNDLISGKRILIKYFSLVSSTVILNRHKFLSLGGYNDTFIGHSYEDFDFLARLLFNTTEFEKMPRAICYDEGSWNLRGFKGFRAWFSLLGYEMSFHGVYMYHFFHEEPNQNNYMSNRRKNHKKFYENLKNLKKYQITPLLDKSVLNDKILLLCNDEKLILNSLRDIISYIGKIQSEKESYFFDGSNFQQDKFLNFIKDKKINAVLFLDPYGNEKRRIIYDFVRENNIKFICYDRGAPDSWFFDINGFNYDSTSYHENNWNKNLNGKQILECQKYIDNVINGNNFLEKQGKRKLYFLEKKYKNSNKKVVFIPLQVENDSVVKYFTYKSFSYENFLGIINKLAEKLQNTHIFIAKKHPLSLKIHSNQYKKIYFVDNNTNIIDLINVCDIVVTLNSGVGVYAMMMKKPCINCANAFYNFEGINYKAKDEQELEKLLNSDLKVDYNKVLKFIWYFRNQHIILYKKSFYGASSFVYLRYIYNPSFFHRIFDQILSIIGWNHLLTHISHSKLFRILRKICIL
ncbi:putative glycosyl transferase [Campylobacter insulaenigrae]|uniref:capsular polysaccharide export protein, LipB/KpsS family n=1 Tax=Campylobacter insulaenigrae TaxID=260714 RepID=UPI000F71E13C|nr:glycosyltransferase [Campylobacter insulaenigrae]MCR6591254.1 galactosyltransferase-related protein [Campylobacter insulaenigrae]MCR6592850.1 galactosyltransferase-related protein [Campylobacter insulaenigrae]VEJ52643.1 putative glycosyl transferase [Campylobacter insulaenigrae]